MRLALSPIQNSKFRIQNSPPAARTPTSLTSPTSLTRLTSPICPTRLTRPTSLTSPTNLPMRLALPPIQNSKFRIQNSPPAARTTKLITATSSNFPRQ